MEQGPLVEGSLAWSLAPVWCHSSTLPAGVNQPAFPAYSVLHTASSGAEAKHTKPHEVLDFDLLAPLSTADNEQPILSSLCFALAFSPTLAYTLHAMVE